MIKMRRLTPSYPIAWHPKLRSSGKRDSTTTQEQIKHGWQIIWLKCKENSFAILGTVNRTTDKNEDWKFLIKMAKSAKEIKKCKWPLIGKVKQGFYYENSK